MRQTQNTFGIQVLTFRGSSIRVFHLIEIHACKVTYTRLQHFHRTLYRCHIWNDMKINLYNPTSGPSLLLCWTLCNLMEPENWFSITDFTPMERFTKKKMIWSWLDSCFCVAKLIYQQYNYSYGRFLSLITLSVKHIDIRNILETILIGISLFKDDLFGPIWQKTMASDSLSIPVLNYLLFRHLFTQLFNLSLSWDKVWAELTGFFGIITPKKEIFLGWDVFDNRVFFLS